jgi:hypothetical protein
MDQPHPDTAAAHAADNALVRIVILMVGVLVAWQVIGALIGGEAGLTIALAAGFAGACYLWRERITFDLVADLALLGLPAVVIGLCLS